MNDYISRDELRKHLADCMTAEFFDSDMKKAVFGIDVYVENMPATDVQPVKHGRWIDCTFYDPYEKSYDQYFEFKCSYCGHIINNKPNDDNWYCGHCGADMRGDTE